MWMHLGLNRARSWYIGLQKPVEPPFACNEEEVKWRQLVVQENRPNLVRSTRLARYGRGQWCLLIPLASDQSAIRKDDTQQPA